MLKEIVTLFTRHPHSLGETYGTHWRAAMTYAARLSLAAGAAFVHAFLPFLFERTASNRVKAVYFDMTGRGATKPAAPPLQDAVDWGWL